MKLPLSNQVQRKTFIRMEVSSFELPPADDILVLGKKSAVGPNAVRKMLDSVAPDFFVMIPAEDDTIEAIFIKKHLLVRCSQDLLIQVIKDEVKPVMGIESMICIKCNITLDICKSI